MQKLIVIEEYYTVCQHSTSLIQNDPTHFLLIFLQCSRIFVVIVPRYMNPTEPLTEISTISGLIFRGIKARPVRRDDNITAIYDPVV
jgi:hypothetical protein